MSELGNRLKQAREEKNISLDDLQAVTKIQKRYLLGIEEGNYAIIPGKFYVRAFIKQYAEAIDLDPDMLFEEYKNEIPSTYNDDVPIQLSRVQTHKQLPKSASKFLDLLPKLLVVAAIVIIAIVVWVWRQSATDDNLTKDTTTEEIGDIEYRTEEPSPDLAEAEAEELDEKEAAAESEPEEEPEPEQPEENTSQSLILSGVKGDTTTYELNGADKFELEVIAKKRTWVSIKNGKGKTFFGAEIPEGKSEVADYTAESQITVRVGNVPGTDLKVNGQLVEYKDTKKTPQNITIIYNNE